MLMMTARSPAQRVYVAGPVWNQFRRECIPKRSAAGPCTDLKVRRSNDRSTPMKIADEAEDGRAERLPAERARSPQLRRWTLFLITALLLSVLAGTIGLWCWAIWWGVTKLIGLVF